MKNGLGTIDTMQRLTLTAGPCLLGLMAGVR